MEEPIMPSILIDAVIADAAVKGIGSRDLLETALEGMLKHANQPSFHIPYLYAALGEPEKATYWVSRICKELISYKPDGLPGDEDSGTMAAWYIFATLGLYPLCPGKPPMSAPPHW